MSTTSFLGNGRPAFSLRANHLRSYQDRVRVPVKNFQWLGR